MLHEKAKMTGDPVRKLFAHLQAEELRVPQHAGQSAEQQVVDQHRTPHAEILSGGAVADVLPDAVGGIGQEAAQGDEQDDRKPRVERIDALRRGRGL